jgi:hypothetical protein
MLPVWGGGRSWGPCSVTVPCPSCDCNSSRRKCITSMKKAVSFLIVVSIGQGLAAVSPAQTCRGPVTIPHYSLALVILSAVSQQETHICSQSPRLTYSSNPRSVSVYNTCIHVHSQKIKVRKVKLSPYQAEASYRVVRC